MKKCSGSVASIETLGLVDGPGIRVVVFLNGCNLRCKYCHNPEMWQKKENNISAQDLVNRILRMRPYFKNNGGVTFSGGEPLLQSSFLLEVLPLLKKEKINVALDTAGFCTKDTAEILDYVDLVLLDIKHTSKEAYQELTGQDISHVEEFIKLLNTKNKQVWIRQVIVPGLTDSEEYLQSLNTYLQKIKNVVRIDFLPYHNLGKSKYEELNIPYPYASLEAMDKVKCEELYQKFKKIYQGQLEL